MHKFLRLISIAGFSLALAACSSRNISSAIPVPVQDTSGTLDVSTPIAGQESRALTGAVQENSLSIAASGTGPYRVHAFLEDTPGNAGCLFSGNYSAVRGEADITESGPSKRGRHPCPIGFETERHNAGFKTYAYNDVAIVGNGMPISAISSAYYIKDRKCTAPFVEPGNGFTNGRQVTSIGHYAIQLASQVNAWESNNSDADYFFNDNFGNIGEGGVPVDSLCQSEWSESNYTSGFPAFLDHLSKPQIVNPVSNYNDSYTIGVARSNTFMVTSEEGIPNFKNGLIYSLAKTEDKLNRLLQFQESGKRVALIQYNPEDRDSSGKPIEFPPGFNTMYDQRMWNYAGGWLILDYDHFYMQTANEGNFTNSGATVEPEYYLVPQNPLKQVSAGAVSRLEVGSLLVREYRSCYFKRKPIGRCAMVLNPNANTTSIRSLAQTYQHSVVISGEGAMPALSGVNGGISTHADTGTLSYSGPRVSSVAAGRAVILIQ